MYCITKKGDILIYQKKYGFTFYQCVKCGYRWYFGNFCHKCNIKNKFGEKHV